MTVPSRPLLVALALGTSLLGTACLPDQIDGRPEPVDARPLVDLSWFEETSALDVIDAGLVAMSEIGSVRLRQDAENPGEGDPVVSKDLLIATGEGIGDAVDGDCTGTLQLPSWSSPAELVVEDDLGAFRGDADFWAGFGNVPPEVLDELGEEYADEWTTTPGLGTLCSFTDFLAPVSNLVGDEDAVKDGLGDVAGVPAGRVVSEGRRMTVTTWVRIAEPHLILRIALEVRGQDGDGTDRTVTTFSDVDSTVDVDFPEPDEIRPFVLPATPPADL